MTLAMTDVDRFWVIFDTCTKLHYYPDLHKLMALPPGYILRYEYRAQWISDEALSAMTHPATGVPLQILLVYAQSRTYVRGGDSPDGEHTPTFGDMLWVPTRLAEMVNI